MGNLANLLEKNKRWANKMRKNNPIFFEELAHQQSPQYLWIGCSDSRVPANQIIDLLPGEVFVHRNVANVIVHSDLNCLSVIQYAVDVLRIKHIIVCGHYGCGGIFAALNNQKLGLIDNWLRHVQDVRQKFKDIFECHKPDLHWDILCELNILEQVINVAQTTVVQDAWSKGQELTVHGWIYKLHDGLLRDLKADISTAAELSVLYENSVASIRNRFAE
ncbi:carbonic anhydrase 2 [Caedimonas varicaedens]|jgi:carbonic anhydrase|uniref:Carbonic anhydrase n=1 Tax=Caedimonas varicaedens TaxID=1629334 RepID=A0A0K8MDX6_9PROT|nr:carbonic anhydrase 2 [Caedimonas varicaedens]